MNPIVVIPTRMTSARLPGKPLALIRGRPMLLHVLKRAQEAAVGPVLVACAEDETAAVVRAAGGVAVITDPALASGSDRVEAALSAFDPGARHDVVVNLQGDEPMIPPTHLHAVLQPLSDPAADIATLVAECDAETAARTQVVKAVCAFEPGQRTARALYFTRAPAPWGEGPFWHHIGLYAYRRAALARFTAAPQGVLERRERLEQLRALEAGMRIDCAQVDHAPFGVDTPEDLDRARAMMGDDA